MDPSKERPRHGGVRLPSRRWLVGASLALLALPTLSLVLLAGPAGAAPSATSPTSTQGSQVGLICPQTTSSTQSEALQSANNYLPVNRWAGSLGNEHTRLPGGVFGTIGSLPNTVQRQVFVGGMTSISSAEWDLGVAASSGASSFCLANSVGATANSMAGNLGKALLNSPIVMLLVVFGLASVLWKAMRGAERPLKQLVKSAAVVGVLATVVGAATISSSSGTGAMFSPEWLITKTYDAVNTVASAPALALSSAAQTATGGGAQQAIAKNDPLSCYWYDAQLVKDFQSAYQSQGSGSYVVPTSLNSLWEQAALPAYINEQFGPSNNYGSLIYCHLLEDQAGTSPRAQMTVALASGALSGDPGLASYAKGHVTGSGSSAGTQWSSLAWNGAITSNQEDESMIGWAACQSPSFGSGGSGFTPTEWDVQSGVVLPTSGWATVANPNDTSTTASGATVTGADCQVFWAANAPASGGQFGDASAGSPFANPAGAPWAGQISNPDYSVFNWGDNWGLITGGTSSAQGLNASTSPSAAGMANLLGNLHGNVNGGAEATAFIFLLASTVIMVVFLVLGLAVIIAKLSLILWMIALPLMMLLWLIPSMSSRFAKYVKHLLGLMLFSTAVGMILSFVAITTNIISSVATTSFGPGSVFSLIFLGISPIVALYLVKKIFKMLSLPSPFSVTGATAIAGAVGGFGGGMAGADLFSHLSRGGRMAASTAKGGMQRYKNTGSVTSPRGRRTSPTAKTGSTGPLRPTGSPVTPPAPSTPGAPGAVPTTTGAPAEAGTSTTEPVRASTPAGAISATAPVGAGAQRVVPRASQRRQRNPRPWETEQALANRHSRGETRKRVAQRAQRLSGSLLKPTDAAGRATIAGKNRAAEVWMKQSERFNSKVGESDRTHRIRGSLLTASAAAVATQRGVRRATPKIVKYGAMGVAGAGVLAFGAPALAGAAGLYGLHKLHRRRFSSPVRAAARTERYQEHLANEEANRIAEIKARDDRANEELERANEAQREAERREKMSAEEAKQAEEARIADEARKVQEAKQADEARVAEEARKAAEARARDENERRWRRGLVGAHASHGGSSDDPFEQFQKSNPFGFRE